MMKKVKTLVIDDIELFKSYKSLVALLGLQIQETNKQALKLWIEACKELVHESTTGY